MLDGDCRLRCFGILENLWPAVWSLVDTSWVLVYLEFLYQVGIMRIMIKGFGINLGFTAIYYKLLYIFSILVTHYNK